MPYLPVGSRPVGHGQLRRLRVDAHRRPHHFAVARPGPQVQRPGVLGDVDREAEGRAVVRPGHEHLAALDEDRFGPWPRAGRHFADLARFRARPLGGLRFATQRDPRKVAREPRRRRHRDAAQILFPIFAGERHAQRAVAAGLVARRARFECGVEARCAAAGDRERRARRRGVRREGGAPRREIGFRAVGAAGARVRERRARAAVQMEFQFAEGQLGVFVERRDDLTGRRVRGDRAADLDEHAVAFEGQVDRERRPRDRPRRRAAQVERALQFSRERRGDDRDGAQFGGVGALHGLFGAESDLGRAARLKARCRRGREHDACGHLHGRVL